MKIYSKVLGFIAASAIVSSCQGNIKEKEATNNTATNDRKVYVDTAKTDTTATLDSINVIALKEDYQKGLLQI